MYDSIIIGCGPAGMTAAIYLARANKKVLILEKESIGGQIASSPLVENYPGYTNISGAELTGNMYDQLENLGVSLELEKVIEIKPGNIKKVITEDNIYETKTIIIACGAKYRTLGLDNEKELIGNGIHFCVACDGAFYKNKEVAVIGGGNSAIINAISLADICKKVSVFQNLSELTCEDALKRNLKEKNNVSIYCNSKVNKYIGDASITGIEVDIDGKTEVFNVDGVFLSIGLMPQNSFAKDVIDLSENNYIASNDCKTNIEGIYVAGDARDKRFRQVTTAVGDGTVSAMLAIDYLNSRTH